MSTSKEYDLRSVFDQAFYLAANPDVARAVAAGTVSAYDHYITFGYLEGRDPSAAFDNTYYTLHNPDVAGAVQKQETTALKHFLQYGLNENRAGSANFASKLYLSVNLDVAEAVQKQETTALEHFLKFGQFEYRRAGYETPQEVFHLAETEQFAATHGISAAAAVEILGVQAIPVTPSITSSNGNRIAYAPYDIVLSSSSVAENTPDNTLIATLSSLDTNTRDSYTYTLLNNAGGRFTLAGNELRVANSTLLNFEASTSHSVILRTTDLDGNRFDETVGINLTNVNEAPFASSPLVDMVSPAGVGAGAFTLNTANFLTDEDAEVLTYSMTTSVYGTGAPAGFLTINAATGQISNNAVLAAQSIYVTVTLTDSLAQTISDTLDLNFYPAGLVSGTIGSDTMNGTAGNNIFFGDNGSDSIDFNATPGGTDTGYGGEGNDTILIGNAGVVGGTAFGGTGGDNITSFGESMVLYGGSGSDTLIGRLNDTMYGGEDDDVLSSGSLANCGIRFYGDEGRDGYSIANVDSRARIADMLSSIAPGGGDYVMLPDSLFIFATDEGVKGNQYLVDDVDIFDSMVNLNSGASFAAGGGATFAYDTTDGELYYDEDGAPGLAVATLVVTIENFATYTYNAWDFTGQ